MNIQQTLALVSLTIAPLASGFQLINPSFEADIVPINSFIGSVPTGWYGIGGAQGVIAPTVNGFGEYAPSDGVNAYWTNGGWIQQDIVAIQAGFTYSIEVDVINRPRAFNGYYVEFRTADGDILKQESNLLSPTSGQYLTTSLNYVVLDGDPVIGKIISIRLGGPTQATFDNVRFTAIPEPAVSGFAIAFSCLVLCVSRRKRG